MTDRIRALRRTLAGLVLAAVAVLTPAAASAQIRDFSFEIPGFDGGGVATGTFSGEDLDGNGILFANGGPGELSSFLVSYSGGTVSPFSLSLSDDPGSFLFSYDFGGSLGTGRNGFIAFSPGPAPPFLTGGPAAGAPCGGSDCFGAFGGGGDLSPSLGTVTELGGPGAPAPLLGVGLLPALAAFGALGAGRWRRKRSPTARAGAGGWNAAVAG